MKRLITSLVLGCVFHTVVNALPAYDFPFEKNYFVKEVSGTITDASTKEPLAGVSIQLKGTTRGTATDNQGNFRLEVPDNNAVLIVSITGYATKELRVGNLTTLAISMEKGAAKSLDEVVVVGYGTQRRGEVTSAVSSVKQEEFTQGFARDAGQLIQGKVAGLSIATTSGNPT